ncbi:MAG: hypothetical protein FWD91_08525, partial [Treponema sp.]|nr:hypothetical protein [Treponema sp.]
YDGKYVFAIGTVGSTALYGVKDITTASALVGAWKGIQVTSGTVAIPIYTINTGSGKFASFNSSGAATTMTVYIMTSETFNYTTSPSFAGMTTVSFISIPGFSDGVTFASGKCTINISAGTVANL